MPLWGENWRPFSPELVSGFVYYRGPSAPSVVKGVPRRQTEPAAAFGFRLSAANTVLTRENFA